MKEFKDTLGSSRSPDLLKCISSGQETRTYPKQNFGIGTEIKNIPMSIRDSPLDIKDIPWSIRESTE